MANDEEFGDGIDDRYIWDGGNVLEILNSIDSPTERFLDGPAVDQVLAVEEVGGDNPGVNWLLVDAQGTVRDVARGVVSGGSVSVSVVDHVIYDAYGRQDTPQSATIQQYQTPIGFRGMLKDALADTSVTTHVSGGGGSGGSGGGGATTLGPFVPAASLYYSANGGWYDAVTETNVSGAAGNESGAVNAYTFMGNDPTTTGLAMRSAAMVSDNAVGLMSLGGGSMGGDTVVSYVFITAITIPVYQLPLYPPDLLGSAIDNAGPINLSQPQINDLINSFLPPESAPPPKKSSQNPYAGSDGKATFGPGTKPYVPHSTPHYGDGGPIIMNSDEHSYNGTQTGNAGKNPYQNQSSYYGTAGGHFTPSGVKPATADTRQNMPGQTGKSTNATPTNPTLNKPNPLGQ